MHAYLIPLLKQVLQYKVFVYASIHIVNYMYMEVYIVNNIKCVYGGIYIYSGLCSVSNISVCVCNNG